MVKRDWMLVGVLVFGMGLVGGEVLGEEEKGGVAGHLSAAEKAYRKGDGKRAIGHATKALKASPKDWRLYNFRGALYFKLGKIKESIKDFDQEIKLNPKRLPYHWQRGICHYYAGRFKDGREQFEVHKKVNPHDVENAVWHFLCTARQLKSVEKAKKLLIPIKGDGRIPMMTVHALFGGKAKAEDVMKNVKENGASGRRLRNQMMFAHLYLGLYYEAMGKLELRDTHITKAAKDFGMDHYMGEVAKVHYRLVVAKRVEKKKGEGKKEGKGGEKDGSKGEK